MLEDGFHHITHVVFVWFMLSIENKVARKAMGLCNVGSLGN